MKDLRYVRHLVMPEIGVEGQEKLRSAKVLVVGAGGLGSPVCLYLAAAGVGEIGIADFDAVDLSNLQRQILHSENDVGRFKVDSTQEKIKSINSDVKVKKFNSKVSEKEIAECDIVVDGSDNFPAKYLINDACMKLDKPLVYGSIFRFEGQASVFRGKPCYRCLYPEPPSNITSCSDSGVLGAVPGVIGSIQAAEAIKLIVGAGEPLIGRLLVFDALGMKFKELRIPARSDCSCSICYVQNEKTDYIETQVSPEELTREKDKVTIVDVREPFEHEFAHIKGSKLIPLGQLEDRLDELHKEDNIVIYCEYGVRSMQALMFLKSRGFKKVRNLSGGFSSWESRL